MSSLQKVVNSIIFRCLTPNLPIGGEHLKIIELGSNPWSKSFLVLFTCFSDFVAKINSIKDLYKIIPFIHSVFFLLHPPWEGPGRGFYVHSGNCVLFKSSVAMVCKSFLSSSKSKISRFSIMCALFCDRGMATTPLW